VERHRALEAVLEAQAPRIAAMYFVACGHDKAMIKQVDALGYINHR
jgi:hypothetical protein